MAIRMGLCSTVTGEDHTGMGRRRTGRAADHCPPARHAHENKGGPSTRRQHARGLLAVQALPSARPARRLHQGEKGLRWTGNPGIATRGSQHRADQYDKHGMDCQTVHPATALVAEAREPRRVETCHQGFDHLQREMWSTSKHGVADLLDPEPTVDRTVEGTGQNAWRRRTGSCRLGSSVSFYPRKDE